MAEGRLITWLGQVPSITAAQFAAFDAMLQSAHGQTRIGTAQYQAVGPVTVASALYSTSLAQAMIRVKPDAPTTLYLNMLWATIPNIAALKVDVQAIFGFQGATIIENAVRL